MKTKTLKTSMIPVGVAALLVAATALGVPTLIRFNPGEPILASELNSNFDTLRTAIATLESTVTSLQTQLTQAQAANTTLSNQVSALSTSLNEVRNRCTAHVLSCTGNPCTLICPAGKHVEAGGCDATNGSTLQESMPATGGNFTDGEHPVDFFDRWHCRVTSGGGLNGAYAYCCDD